MLRRAIPVLCRAAALGVILMIGFPAFSSVRQPAVAGAFYPGSEEQLAQMVGKLLSDSPPPGKEPVAALVVPHAGFVYSGALAAQGFRRLEGQDVRRVVLLGPSHRASFSGGALPKKGVTAFQTPLGDVELDHETIDRLRGVAAFAGPASAHDGEHCLEVELPFIQTVVPHAKVVPILVGYHTDREMVREMALALGDFLDPQTVVVVSTDFSHHGEAYRWAPFPDEEGLGDRLLELGRATGALVADGQAAGFWHQVETSGDTVCGRKPVSVLLELVAQCFKGRGQVLDVTTSGHVSGDFAQSVTYVAVGFFGQWTACHSEAENMIPGELDSAQRQEVLGLARATFETHLGHGPELARWFSANGQDPAFGTPAGAFVTLHHADVEAGKPGRLRACMGVIDAGQPLVDAVVQAAVSAAHDPRFDALDLAELNDLEVEVSILSPRRRVDGPQDIQVGKHGVVLSRGGRSAVFLPQVAPEQGWDRDTMLSHLARKAGLPADAWRDGAHFEVFTAQVFGEGEESGGAH